MSALIVTRYLGPTDHHGARVRAAADLPMRRRRRPPLGSYVMRDASVTVPYPYELSGPDAHRAAAVALVARVWPDPADRPDVIYAGHLPIASRDAYAFRIAWPEPEPTTKRGATK